MIHRIQPPRSIKCIIFLQCMSTGPVYSIRTCLLNMDMSLVLSTQSGPVSSTWTCLLVLSTQPGPVSSTWTCLLVLSTQSGPVSSTWTCLLVLSTQSGPISSTWTCLLDLSTQPACLSRLHNLDQHTHPVYSPLFYFIYSSFLLSSELLYLLIMFTALCTIYLLILYTALRTIISTHYVSRHCTILSTHPVYYPLYYYISSYCQQPSALFYLLILSTTLCTINSTHPVYYHLYYYIF